MGIYRVTWQFISANGGSWNELFYCNATDPANAVQLVPGLVTARLNLLHVANTFLGIRAAQIGGARLTTFSQFNYSGRVDNKVLVTPDLGPDLTGTAFVIHLGGLTGGSRKLWLRGLPDGYTGFAYTGNAPDIPPAVFSGLKSLIQLWADNGYGLLQVAPQSPGPTANKQILKVDGSAGNGTSIITLSDVPGFATPARVIIGGCSAKDTPALNGRWQVLSVGPGNTVTIRYQTPGALVVTGGNGHLRQEIYPGVNVINPATSGLQYQGTRKTKNSFTHSRGARRAVRIRTSL